MERKNFLRSFAIAAAAGPMLVEACKKESGVTASASTTTASSASGCITTPTEEEGPYPYVGGELTNPLNRSNVVETQTGVALGLNFVVVNTNDNCNVVDNVRVDIWSCNPDGYYSGYASQAGGVSSVSNSYTGATWLRGYQLTDASGVAKFSTIYPGWYSGRATHVHIEVYVNSVLKKTGQLAFSEAISDVVHVSTRYAAHGINTTRNAADHVFDDSATDLANETLSLTGSVAAGYAGSYTIGLAL